MGLCTYIVAVVLAVLLGVYVNIPPPPLSSQVEAWKKRGQMFQYQNYDIFFIAEKGLKPERGTVLILHGFPTSSYDWIKIFENLKQEFGQVVVYDLLGLGFSDKPKGYDYTIAEQADIGEALLEKLGVRETHLLSHDYGDTVALELLARQNSGKEKIEVKSLCLSNGGVFPETNHPRPIQRLLLTPVLGYISSHLSWFYTFKRSLGEVFGEQTQPTYEEFVDFYAILRQQHGNLVLPGLLQYIPERSKYKERWVGALIQANIPVHMIYGPSDPVNPSKFADFYRKTVPNPSITVLASHISHYPQWEDPEAFMKSYQQFLDSLQT